MAFQKIVLKISPSFFLFFLFSLLAINYSRNIRNTILVFVNLDAGGVPPPSQTRAIHIFLIAPFPLSGIIC